MAWMLRVTDKVVHANREAYERMYNEVLDQLPGNARAAGSYRVAFGESLEYMHLIEFGSLSDYENAPPGTWDTVIEGYENNLAVDSRWEWLRVLR